MWSSRLHSWIVSSFVCAKFFLLLIFPVGAVDHEMAQGLFYFENCPAAYGIKLCDFLSGSICSVQIDAAGVHFHQK